MASDSVTLTYTKIDGSAETVVATVKGQAFDSEEDFSRRQEILETEGDLIHVYELAREKVELNYVLADLTPQERADVEQFFSSNYTDYAKRWFTIDIAAPVRMAQWTPGSSVGGVAIIPGAGYYPGQWLLLDAIRYTVRLVDPRLHFSEGRIPERYTCTLRMRVLFGFLPANS